VTGGGYLGFHDDATNTNTVSTTQLDPTWHALELHLQVNGSYGTVQVWLDGLLVRDLENTVIDLGNDFVGMLQIGETQTGQTYDVLYDDAAFGTGRLGPVGDVTPPSVPGGPTVTATSPFSVRIDWTAATDDTGVTGYDVLRDGQVIASVDGATTTSTDSTVLAGSSHTYAVRARDLAGNVSMLTTPVPVTTAAAATPVFSDGFETGDLSAWTTTAGLTVTTADHRNGSYAAEGNTTNGNTYAKKTLPSTYTDAYARVGYKIKSQSAQVNLLRLRDAAGNSLGYVFLSSSGLLGVRNDVAATTTTSTVAPGTGWHTVELHFGISTGTIEVWLDGSAVPALTTSTGANLGSAAVGGLQIGETQTGRTYDVLYDDAAFGTSRLGL
jgi:hypothetical protein